MITPTLPSTSVRTLWLPFKLRNPAWKAVDEDIEAVERLFDIKAGPQTPEQEKHAQLAADLVKISDKETKTTLISRQAILRKFLG
jgi:phosphoenolpyruvate carboxylase